MTNVLGDNLSGSHLQSHENSVAFDRLVKAFIVVALCEVGLQPDYSSSNLSVCIGFLYTVVRSSLLAHQIVWKGSCSKRTSNKLYKLCRSVKLFILNDDS